MKSVLHIGIDVVTHSRRGLEKGFKDAGFTDYHFFNWQEVRFSEGILGCQSRMIRAAQALSPDLIFIQFQNSEICDEETAMELSKCGFTVNYTFDCRSMEQTEWMYDLAHYFGLTLFACKEDADEGKRRGLNNVGHIHSSCDTEQYRPIQLSDEVKAQYPEIVFIGNNYENTNLNFELSKQRAEMVAFMKDEFGDRFRVFGMNWGKDSKMINPIDEVNIYNSCKLVLTHNNFLRTGYCSDRQWRAISCGAATVLQWYPEIRNDFSEGCYAWQEAYELKHICHILLGDDIHRVSHGRLLRQDFLNTHTWKNRVEQIKKMINGLPATTK